MKAIDVPGLPATQDFAHHATVAADRVFCSLLLGIDRTSGRIPTGLSAQLDLALSNLDSVLRAAGSDVTRIVQMTVYLRDLSDAEPANEAICDRLSATPSISTVEVSEIQAPAGELPIVALDAVAAL